MTDKPARIALVTGANRGIGFEVGRQLAAQGFVVLLTAPPGSEKWTWHEQQMDMPGSAKSNPMVRNVVIPTVTMLRPAGAANGTALIVAPGGAFSFLMVGYEGYDMARWIAQQGVTAFGLRYRVAHTPENDADMPALLQNLFRVLPHPGPTVETPPVGTEGDRTG